VIGIDPDRAITQPAIVRSASAALCADHRPAQLSAPVRRPALRISPSTDPDQR